MATTLDDVDRMDERAEVAVLREYRAVLPRIGARVAGDAESLKACMSALKLTRADVEQDGRDLQKNQKLADEVMTPEAREERRQRGVADEKAINDERRQLLRDMVDELEPHVFEYVNNVLIQSVLGSFRPQTLADKYNEDWRQLNQRLIVVQCDTKSELSESDRKAADLAKLRSDNPRLFAPLPDLPSTSPVFSVQQA